MNHVLKFEDAARWYGGDREQGAPRTKIMWCRSLKPTDMKRTTEYPLHTLNFIISLLWTKYIYFVSKKYKKTYFVASIGRDDN